MEQLSTLIYDKTGRIARITLNRPERANAITLDMPAEIADCVERANLDPEVHVIALAGNGKGFCAGYDLVIYGEQKIVPQTQERWPQGSPMDVRVQCENHEPGQAWDPAIDYAMMSRNVRGFMSLFHSEKPVVCKIHAFCIGGGTDLALCSDLLVVEDTAKIAFTPARTWGVPTTALWTFRIGVERAKRLLYTGDCLSGKEAVTWGLACESAPQRELDNLFERLLYRISLLPVNQLVMHKLLINQALFAQGLHSTQLLGTVLDGIARHTSEGQAFRQYAADVGFKKAVRKRDEPFDDNPAKLSKE